MTEVKKFGNTLVTVYFLWIIDSSSLNKWEM